MEPGATVPSEANGILRGVSDPRRKLTTMLHDHYRAGGRSVKQSAQGLLEVSGPGGVTWIGRAVVGEDFHSDGFEAEIVELADRRMPAGGELCPLDLLPDASCEPQLRELLERTGLDRRPHVSVYSLAA